MKYIVVDIETSGFTRDKGGRIIELGLCVVKNGEIIEEYSELFNPMQKISNKIVKLTGITNEELKEKDVLYNRLPFIYEKYMRGNVLVFHNKHFDWDRFLLPDLEMLGYSPTNKVIDTQAMAKSLKKKISLKELCKEYGIENDQHHRALNDARATAKVFLRLQEEYNNTLFKLAEENAGVSLVVNPKEIEIYTIKKWEAKGYERVYVNSNIGNFFYCLNYNYWAFKEKKTEKEIKMSLLEQLVLKRMGLTKDGFLKKYKSIS